MRGFGAALVIVAIIGGTAGRADAGLGKKCRKTCKPMIAECVSFTGQSKRACKKTFLPACKREGLQVCSFSTTTTTLGDGPGNGSTSTTTTLPGTGNEGGGVMYLDVDDVAAAGDEDPRAYTISITIEYGVVTVNAATQVSLDPAYFSVYDEDTQTRYPAEPASAAGDCSAAHVISLDGGEVTCTLHFSMPISVGDLSPVSGGVHSLVEFDVEALGFHGQGYFAF